MRGPSARRRTRERFLAERGQRCPPVPGDALAVRAGRLPALPTVNRKRRTGMHLRRPSPGLAIAVVALFIALGGTASAAHFLITSTSQIKPSVLKKLRGKR